MNNKKKTIWLAGGGTGGHISPAISIFEILESGGYLPVLITLEKNRDYPSLKKMNSKKQSIIFYRASPIPKSWKTLVSFFRDIQYSFQLLNMESRIHLPDAVIAFGGYPVFPVLIWALYRRIPYYLHEQNVRHGVITRLFKWKARKIFLSFPKHKYMSRECLVGNPLRQIFLKAERSMKKSVATKKKLSFDRILLLGGSQGARDINNLYLEMCQSVDFKKKSITISTGKQEFEEIKKQSKKLKRKKDQIFPFIEDVPRAMLNSDLVISRSGSGLIFEILWSKKPACFIPFPHAASDHQKYNSLFLNDVGHYATIDIRPFDPAAAIRQIQLFLTDLENRPHQAGDISEKIPLNAHERIRDILLNDLASG